MKNQHFYCKCDIKHISIVYISYSQLHVHIYRSILLEFDILVIFFDAINLKKNNLKCIIRHVIMKKFQIQLYLRSLGHEKFSVLFLWSTNYLGEILDFIHLHDSQINQNFFSLEEKNTFIYKIVEWINICAKLMLSSWK